VPIGRHSMPLAVVPATPPRRHATPASPPTNPVQSLGTRGGCIEKFTLVVAGANGKGHIWQLLGPAGKHG
jgi:hypothetical protein